MCAHKETEKKSIGNGQADLDSLLLLVADLGEKIRTLIFFNGMLVTLAATLIATIAALVAKSAAPLALPLILALVVVAMYKQG